MFVLFFSFLTNHFNMRNTFLILFLILTACQSNSGFIIKGQLPDKTYDGEVIYLVPLENAIKERVDSATIRDGKFHFQGETKKSEIYIIRAKPILRFRLEELLVVREPGEVIVTIGTNSSASGTALNDSLQHWKEKKKIFDSLNDGLVNRLRIADESEKFALNQKADSLSKFTKDFHSKFVENNKNNIVGKFVEKIMASSFSRE